MLLIGYSCFAIVTVDRYLVTHPVCIEAAFALILTCNMVKCSTAYLRVALLVILEHRNTMVGLSREIELERRLLLLWSHEHRTVALLHFSWCCTCRLLLCCRCLNDWLHYVGLNGGR